MPHSRHAELESIVATVDQLLRLESIGDIVRAIARGFVDIGAVASVVLVRDGEGGHDCLRVAARWPEKEVDDLFGLVRGTGAQDFTIEMSERDNPYVKTLESGEPMVIRGSENVLAHIAATYGATPEHREELLKVLHGRAGVVLPLMSAGERLGIAALNYAEELQGGDLHLFDIFAQSAASMLRFKREVVGREQILADLEQALENERRTRAELNRAERLAALGEMAAVVAHEIRNPLAVIRNSLSSLHRYVEPTHEAELLEGILGEETTRIERIIDDMLALAVPSGSRRHEVDLREVLSRAVFLARQECDDGDPLDVDEQLEGAVGQLEGDAHSLTQAFVNLLLNAHQASNGEAVDIVASVHRTRGRPRVRILFRDRGTGMDPATLSRIWEPFYTTKASGTGLGLSIVKRVIDAHDGVIEVSSEVGLGTEIVVDLPARETSVAPPEAAEVLPVAPSGHRQ